VPAVCCADEEDRVIKIGKFEYYYVDDHLYCAELVRAMLDGKWLHIRRADGAPAYPQRYDYVGHFSAEGLAHVKLGDKWFHIHTDGSPAYTERYDSAGWFHDGLAWVTLDGEGFDIDTNGARVVK
jgi:hypothetical protein